MILITKFYHWMLPQSRKRINGHHHTMTTTTNNNSHHHHNHNDDSNIYLDAWKFHGC